MIASTPFHDFMDSGVLIARWGISRFKTLSAMIIEDGNDVELTVENNEDAEEV